MDRKNVEYVCLIAAKMIENGAEISWAEDSALRMLRSLGCVSYCVFCLSSLVIICADGYIVMNRIYVNDLNLSEIDRLNTLSRCICSGIEPINRKPQEYPLLCRFLAVILATGSFCIYFGGTFSDAAFSGIIGIIISLLPRISSTSFAQIFIQSIVAGILSYVPLLLGISSQPAMIMIGTIMLLIPGIAIGSAIRDIMLSDTISGLVELTQSLFYALAIALGFCVGVIFFDS